MCVCVCLLSNVLGHLAKASLTFNSCVCVWAVVFLLKHMTICCLALLSHDLKGGKAPLSTTCFKHDIVGDKSALIRGYFLLSCLFLLSFLVHVSRNCVKSHVGWVYATVNIFNLVCIFPESLKKFLAAADQWSDFTLPRKSHILLCFSFICVNQFIRL